MLFLALPLLWLAGRACGLIARRLGQPAVIGELCAGVLLGLTGLAGLFPPVRAVLLPDSPSDAAALSNASLIAVLLLLLVTGLDVDAGLIRRRLGAAAGISFGGLIVPLAAGIAVGMLLPASLLTHPDGRLAFAVFLGTAMTISAIPVLAKILIDLGLTRRAIGGTILVAAVVDDPIGWTLLAIVAALATGGAFDAAGVAGAVVSTAAFLMGAVTVGRWAIGRTFAIARGPVAHVIAVGVWTLIGAWISGSLGLEAFLGAFTVGVLINGLPPDRAITPRARHALEWAALTIAAPIFFGLVGLKVDARALFSDPGLIAVTLLVIAVASASKIAGVYAGARLFAGADRWTALFYGVGLNARGSMLLIVAALGVRLGVVSPPMLAILVALALVTSIAAPPLLRFTLSRIPPDPDPDSPHCATRELPAVQPQPAGAPFTLPTSSPATSPANQATNVMPSTDSR